MKNVLILGISLWIAAFVLMIFPTDADAEIYEDTMRLHVIANSDTDVDQEVKMKIKDKLVETYGEAIYGETLAEAEEKARALLPSMEAAVNGWLTEADAPYGATVTLSREVYGTRYYEDFSMPGGEYLSLRVILGEGAGENWWCVMFPPLCLDLATEEAPMEAYSDEEQKLITEDGYQVKFKLLEVVSAIDGKIKKSD